MCFTFKPFKLDKRILVSSVCLEPNLVLPAKGLILYLSSITCKYFCSNFIKLSSCSVKFSSAGTNSKTLKVKFYKPYLEKARCK